MTPAAARPRVIYIMGSGRSGTTLLGSILGEYAGAFAAGEVSYLWERGILEPRGCGCGAEPMECPIWGPVIQRVSAGKDPHGVAREQLRRRREIRLRHTRALLRRGPISASGPETPDGTTTLPDADRYGAVLQEVYRAIARETGSSVIVDTSKHPADAAVVGRLADIESIFVHVVRDPRGVTHSWRRRKHGIARRKAILAALDWVATNRAADSVRRRHAKSSLLLRYEDLMGAPANEVARIVALAGLPPAPSPFSDARTVELRTNHTVSGNPDRFVAGPTTIALDDRWRREMPSSLKALVTAVTATELRRYGYSLRS